MGWEWDFSSAIRSSRITTVGFGCRQTSTEGQFSNTNCRQSLTSTRQARSLRATSTSEMSQVQRCRPGLPSACFALHCGRSAALPLGASCGQAAEFDLCQRAGRISVALHFILSGRLIMTSPLTPETLPVSCCRAMLCWYVPTVCRWTGRCGVGLVLFS